MVHGAVEASRGCFVGSETARTVWASRRAGASGCTQSTEGGGGDERGKGVCL